MFRNAPCKNCQSKLGPLCLNCQEHWCWGTYCQAVHLEYHKYQRHEAKMKKLEQLNTTLEQFIEELIWRPGGSGAHEAKSDWNSRCHGNMTHTN